MNLIKFVENGIHNAQELHNIRYRKIEKTIKAMFRNGRMGDLNKLLQVFQCI